MLAEGILEHTVQFLDHPGVQTTGPTLGKFELLTDFLEAHLLIIIHLQELAFLL